MQHLTNCLSPLLRVIGSVTQRVIGSVLYLLVDQMEGLFCFTVFHKMKDFFIVVRLENIILNRNLATRRDPMPLKSLLLMARQFALDAFFYRVDRGFKPSNRGGKICWRHQPEGGKEAWKGQLLCSI